MPAGQIIVSKVFVGHSMPLRVAEQIDRSRYPKAFSVYQNLSPALSEGMSQQSKIICERLFPLFFFQCLSLFFCSFHVEKQLAYKTLSVPECNPSSRLWFIFDHELILPEYLIYFEYIEKVSIFFSLFHTFNVHVQYVSLDCCFCRSKDRDQPEVLAQMGLDGIISNYVAYDKEVLSMEPVLKPQPRLLSLDDKILLNVARANVLSQITVSGKANVLTLVLFSLPASSSLVTPTAPADAEPSWQQSE